jgi:hypothetical protein
MTRIRNFLLNRKGLPRAQLGKSPNEMPSEKQVDPDLDLPFLVRKLWMRLERGANLIGIPREALELAHLLPPLLAPTVLLVLRVVLRVRVAKIVAVTELQDLVHRNQKGTKRQRLEDNVKADLPFLELTLLPHRLQDESKTDWLLVSLNQIRPLMLPVLSTKKKRVRTSQWSQCQ